MQKIRFILLLIIFMFTLNACSQSVTTKNVENLESQPNTNTAETPATVPEESIENQPDNVPSETYTLYYYIDYIDHDSYVGIAAFKNAEDQSMADFLIEAYKLKEYKQFGNYEIIIPATIDGITVLGIESAAFDNCDSIISIQIPECCTHIEAGAFTRGCNDDLIIYGASGSEAEKHAQEYDLSFRVMQ